MGRPALDSPEYFAQQFRDCLKGTGVYSPGQVQRTLQSGWKARHKGNYVEFEFGGNNYFVGFTVQGVVVTARLETKVGEEEICLLETNVDTQTTKTGKLSPNSMVKLFEKKLIPQIVKYIREDNSADCK